MKKSFAVWASMAGALALLVMASCGSGEEPDSFGAGPGSDAGAQVDAGWVFCDPLDGGTTLLGCADGEACRYVESVGRTVCARGCDPDTLCVAQGVVCCASENAGASGYCLPKNDCTPPSPRDGGVVTGPGPSTDTDAGTDAGGGSQGDAGVEPGDGADTSDAGVTPDAGVMAPDAGAAGPDAGTTPDAGTSPDGGTGYANIRIMAANLTSGNMQSYDPGHGQQLMQGVKPDVVLIQEFNYASNTTADIRGFVTRTFDASFQYYREGGAQIPNGVISRWPIIESGEWPDPEVGNRDFAWARIDIPGPRDLWVVSVHLLTSSATDRNAEARSLVERIKANVPTGDYLAVGGDFNTGSRSEACFSTFSQVLTTSGPHPADQNGVEGTSASRSKPLDVLLVDADLRAYQTATVIGASTYGSGLVLDSRVYRPLSEIAPAQSGDSGATNMQHMGVVKDFRVPL